MFPLSAIQYVKAGLCIAVLCFSWYLGFSFEHSRFVAYKADQITKTQAKEAQFQQDADQIRIQKDAQIASINNSLADALVQLRSRPNRTQAATNGQGGTGLSLSAEDASFLDREAARADVLRSALDACYQQYDSLK